MEDPAAFMTSAAHRPAGAATRVDVYSDANALARAAAETVVDAAARAIARYGRFLWCLAGGHTPRPTYELLATEAFASRIDWERVHVFFGDERGVPPTHERSNYRMVREALLGRIQLPAGHVHRIAGERDPDRAALDYERTLESVLGRSPDGNPLHGFDLLLLGMGTDGHTASLFPGSVDDPDRWVEARRHPTEGDWRVTLTPTVLDASACVRFVVSGTDKAERLADVLTGPPRPRELPVYRVRPASEEATWMVDRAAAGDLVRDRSAAKRASHIQLEVHA